jgi:meso-butanediol dehydrogenase / (S,S)-butanediol dehydrogenase / diacetyl reductase
LSSNGFRLEGKRVLLTGTAGGQGAAAQRLFAEHGARIAGCDVQPGAAERTAQGLREAGFDVRGSTVDLSDAGFGFSPFADMTLDLWRHVMRVELDIVFHTTQPAWQHLCDGGGSVINTASYSALRGIEPLGAVAHAAAKGGVIAMTRTLATEGAKDGVRANAISPGFVSSPATDAAVDDEARAWQLSKHLIQRPGECVDVAYCALYLASDESTWVTGQNLCVDGGVTAGFR